MTEKKCWMCIECGVEDICININKNCSCKKFKYYEIKQINGIEKPEAKIPIPPVATQMANIKNKKEPEMMTIEEAISKIKPGDKLKNQFDVILIMNHDESISYFNTVLEGKKVRLNKEVFKTKWQIIPAEPKVLTADQWIQTKYKSFRENEYPKIHAGFEAGEENQWLNHKELRESVNNFMEDIYDNTLSKVDVLSHVRKIEYARKNLKPLKAE